VSCFILHMPVWNRLRAREASGREVLAGTGIPLCESRPTAARPAVWVAPTATAASYLRSDATTCARASTGRDTVFTYLRSSRCGRSVSSLPVRTLGRCGALILAVSLLACTSSSSPPAPSDGSLDASDASLDANSDAPLDASDASLDANSDAGIPCVAAGFTCQTLGSRGVCQSPGPRYSCDNASETCCTRDSSMSVDSGFCVAASDGSAGGATAISGTCAGQPCGSGCSCGLVGDGGVNFLPSGKPVCLCAVPPTSFCFQNPECGQIICGEGCTCSDPVAGTCDCPTDGGPTDAVRTD
jgi:hypothetical protein